ncbi:MAG: protein kinase [Ardenticatenaceae bacterium]|nr:protein kinase [Ardenticatenaceae bacterium]
MASTHNKQDSDNLISHYTLNELLVEQPVSVIYRAQDKKNGDAVFLLTLQPDAVKSNDLTERFLRRAETLSQLKHASLLPILDYGQDGKRPYAIMPYRSGQFLAAKLAKSPKPSEDKAEIIANLNLTKRIAAGLSVAHPNGLIHHDLRPENIYLDDAGQPYLLDLAVPPTPPVVPYVEEAPPTELDFQSPEQQAGKALSGRSNIFSLGVLLYRLLAGQNPALPTSEWDIFEHKGMAREQPLKQVRTDLTPETYTAVQDSIWQKEWSRYETVDAQIEAIDRAIAAESAPPPPPPPAWAKLLDQVRHANLGKFIIPAAVLLLLLILAMMFLRARANRQSNTTPTPDATALPQESAPEEAISPSETPQITIEEDAEAENDPVLIVEETETPTARPSSTATAVPPTATATSTATSLPTLEPSPTATQTETPTLEPTTEACFISPPFGWVRYAIQPNDSLSSLGETTNTTVEQIMQVNCLDSILLSIGQEIWLPPVP